MPTDAMVLVILVDLPKIFIKAILVGELHHAKPVVHLDFACVNPLLERDLLQLIPFVGTSLIPRLVLPR